MRDATHLLNKHRAWHQFVFTDREADQMRTEIRELHMALIMTARRHFGRGSPLREYLLYIPRAIGILRHQTAI